MITVSCKICNKKFKAQPSVIKIGGAKYCSRKCFYLSMKGRPYQSREYRKTGIIRNCPICNKEFYAQPSRIKCGKHRYCSTECFSQSLIGKRGEGAGNWRGGITPLHLQIRTSLEFKQWRNGVFERDNYVCQNCGVRNGNGFAVHLHAHHIEPFSKLLNTFMKKYNQHDAQRDKEILIELAIAFEPFWDKENGITLCRECHKKNHGGTFRVDLLEAHLE